MSKQNLVALVAGLLFAVGLGIAGMTQPEKVINFLDITGTWDPSLAFVMGGAILVYMPIMRLMRRRGRAVLAPTLQLPTRNDLDARLLLGSALFGIGWGLAGYCPGPALVSLTSLTVPALAFGAAMFAGMSLYTLYERSKKA